jgi:G3E family GTPase
LDHELLERIDENMVLLRAGCLCCTIRGELAEAIRDLHERRARGDIPAFRRLVIESTGLADPLPILTTITADRVLRHHYRLGLVIATVDAVNGSWQLGHQPESMKQAAVADRLAITKTDIASQDQVDALMRRLRRINPAAPIFSPAAAEFNPEDILGYDLFDLESKSQEVQRWFHVEAEAVVEADHEDHHHKHDANRHGDDIESFHLAFDQPINWTAFGLWLSLLLHRHGEAILRVKGLLSIEGESAPVAVHGVQQLVHSPTHLSRWPSDDRRTRIVFICRGLDSDVVRRSFAAFVLKQRIESGLTPVLPN